MTREIKVAVCGELPTACDFLLRNGVVQIDQYQDAAEITDETNYQLILIYAPHAEGLLNTHYARSEQLGDGVPSIPIRWLNEPCCHSALVELRSTVRRIEQYLTQMRCEGGVVI